MFSFHLILFSFSQSLPDPLDFSIHPTLCSQSLLLKKKKTKQKTKYTKTKKSSQKQINLKINHGVHIMLASYFWAGGPLLEYCS